MLYPSVVILIAFLLQLASPFKLRVARQIERHSRKRFDLQVSPFDNLLRENVAEGPRFVFVGGKGGVGKTTSSSGIAIKLSDAGLRTLIVSTDPAHSLGDALDVKLPPGLVTPISTETNLWALEIDIEESLEEFRAVASSLNAASLSSSLGIPRSMIDSLGLEDLTSLLTNPPPGIDEIVALSKIIKYGDSSEYKFQRIVIDTAPTGHTLRLLQLPKFVNSLTGNLMKLRGKIVGAVNSFQNMFGSADAKSSKSSSGDSIESTLNKLEGIQESMKRVQTVLKDPKRTEFVGMYHAFSP
jgi:arsenite-transporting ATPase